jgi:hypothetical protein
MLGSIHRVFLKFLLPVMAAFFAQNSLIPISNPNEKPVGAPEGCDLLTLIF